MLSRRVPGELPRNREIREVREKLPGAEESACLKIVKIFSTACFHSKIINSFGTEKNVFNFPLVLSFSLLLPDGTLSSLVCMSLILASSLFQALNSSLVTLDQPVLVSKPQGLCFLFIPNKNFCAKKFKLFLICFFFFFFSLNRT